MGDFIVKAEVKTLLQIGDSSKDGLIDVLIPIVKDDLLEHLNNDFGGDTPDFPEGMKIHVAAMIGFKLHKPKDGIQSESVSRYSVTYKSDSEMIDGYPASIMKGFRKWKKVKW